MFIFYINEYYKMLVQVYNDSDIFTHVRRALLALPVLLVHQALLVLLVVLVHQALWVLLVEQQHPAMQLYESWEVNEGTGLLHLLVFAERLFITFWWVIIFLLNLWFFVEKRWVSIDKQHTEHVSGGNANRKIGRSVLQLIYHKPKLKVWGRKQIYCRSRDGYRGGLGRLPPLKRVKVTVFTMVLYNSENNIRD